MPRLSKEASEARRAEIIDACEALYRTESYRDITMTQVGERVSFGRANVYNYFQCKDEILLALLQREYECWAADLEALAADAAGLDDEDLAGALARSAEARITMLKLLAMNLYDIEQNSRLGNLVDFKRTYLRAVKALHGVVRAAKPAWGDAEANRFVFGFLPFLHGVYPFAFHSDKQLAAMDEAGVSQPGLTVFSAVRDLARSLLRGDAGA